MNESAPPSTREQRLNEVIASYLRAVESGEAPDRQQWLDRHPDLADGLASFFADCDAVLPAAAPLRADPPLSVSQAPTVAPHTPRPEATVARLQVLGDYELLEEIARGGMGVVYRARQVSLRRIVALKMILAGQLASSDDVERFHREAKAAARLDHPHIVPIHEVGEYQGQHYFSMKLIEGGSLAQHMTSFAADHPAAVRLLVVVARAVEYAHRHGTLHRDLKPANILLERRGEGQPPVPLVTDFGLAKRVEGDVGLTQSGAIVGTPSYMPPEQAMGRKEITAAVDVYSLGAVLYEMLTGRPPFVADTPLDVLLQVLEKTPAPPREINPQVDENLQAVCLTCLQKDPARRYPSAAALADDLENWLAGRQVQARPVQALPAPRLRRRGRRRPVVLAALLSLAAGLVLGMLVRGWVSGSGAREEDLRGEMEQVIQAVEKDRQLAYDHRILLAAREWYAPNAGEAAIGVVGPGRPRGGAPAEGRNSSEADRLLLDCPPDLRNWEWHYLQRRFHEERQVFGARAGPLTCLAFSPDGSLVATGGRDFVVRVWEAVGGKEVHALQGHRGLLTGLSFSGDGKLLASGSLDGTARVWEVTTGKERHVLGGDSPFHAVAFAPKGTRLATAGRSAARLWDAAAGKEVWSFPGSGGADAIAFHPGGEIVAVGRGGGQASIQLYDAVTGKSTRAVGGTAVVKSLAFSPDGRQLAVGSAGPVILYDASGGVVMGNLTGHTGVVHSVSFRRDGLQLVSGGSDQTIRVWNLRPGVAEVPRLSARGAVAGVAFSPDGKSVAAVGAEPGVQVWNLGAAQDTLLLPRRTERFAPLAFHPDGTRLAGAVGGTVGGPDRPIKTWDTLTGKEVGSWPGPALPLFCLAFSPDGSRLAGGGGLVGVLANQKENAVLKVWDARSGAVQIECKGHAGVVCRVAFHPDGRRLTSVGRVPDPALPTRPEIETAEVKVWNAETGQEDSSWTFDAPGYRSALSPDGQQVAWPGASKEGLWPITVRHAPTGRELRVLPGHEMPIRSLVFRPDGKQLASAAEDRVVKVWDIETGQEVSALTVRGGALDALVFTPDGKRLIGGGPDQTLRVWDLGTGQEVLVFRMNGATVDHLAMSPDGKRLVSADSSSALRLWNAAPLPPEALEERAAASTVALLLDRLLLREDVVRHLQSDPTLPTWLREAAVRRAGASTEDPDRLANAAGNIVRRSSMKPDEYRVALRRIERACELRPEDPLLLNILGMAQYRVGRYADALSTLRLAERMDPEKQNRSLASVLAFLAMICQQLGKADDARSYLERCRQALQTPEGARDGWGNMFLREAEALIEPKPKPADGPVGPGASGPRHTFSGFKEIVWAVAVSPDSRHVLAGGGGDLIDGKWVAPADNAVHLYDAESGKEVNVFKNPPGIVYQIAWSPEGRRAYWSNGATIHAWDVAEGKEVEPFKDAGSVESITLSADGKLLLSGGNDATVRLWDVPGRKELKRFGGYGGRVWDVALSPDGKQAASCGDGGFNETLIVRVWDVAGGKVVRVLMGHTGQVVRVVYSPDGSRLLTGAWDNTARLWDAETGKQIQVFQGHTDRVEGLAFSPDGKRVLTGSLDRTVRLWDAATGKEVQRFEGHTSAVGKVAFAPDSRFVVSGGWDHTARLWRLPEALK